MVTTRSTTRSTKVGPQTTLVQRTTNNGKTSNSFRTRIKNGPNSWITKTMGPRGETFTSSTRSGGATFSTSTHQSPAKPTINTSSTYSSGARQTISKSSKNSHKGSSSLGAVLIFALIAGIVWLFSLFSKSK